MQFISGIWLSINLPYIPIYQLYRCVEHVQTLWLPKRRYLCLRNHKHKTKLQGPRRKPNYNLSSTDRLSFEPMTAPKLFVYEIIIYNNIKFNQYLKENGRSADFRCLSPRYIVLISRIKSSMSTIRRTYPSHLSRD